MCGLCGAPTTPKVDEAVIVTEDGVLYACPECAILAEDMEFGEVFMAQ